MTRAEILADLKVLIGNGIEVSDGNLYTWINDGYSQLVDEVISYNPDYFTKTGTINLVAGTREYALPTDCEKIVMVEVYNDGTWLRYSPLQNIGYLNAPTQQDTYSTTEPKYYLIGSSIGLDPTPTESVTNGIKIYYTYTPTELTSDSSVPAIPARYHHLIKYWAYALYLDRDDEHVSAERMRQRFDAQLSKMRDNMFGTQIDETKSVEIVNDLDMF